jgi:hypothetical protein
LVDGVVHSLFVTTLKFMPTVNVSPSLHCHQCAALNMPPSM